MIIIIKKNNNFSKYYSVNRFTCPQATFVTPKRKPTLKLIAPVIDVL